MRRIAGVLLTFLIAIGVAAQPNTEQSDFRAAAARPSASERVQALEHFLAAHPQSSLRLDALELLVWNCRTAGSIADLEHWISELLTMRPENPLAEAVIIGNSLPIAKPEPPANRARAALRGLDRFDRPEGLSHQEFAAMKNFVEATLNGVVGYSYFEQKEFAAARPYLRKSVALFPDDAQLTYTLALSDLEGTGADQAEGFMYLARTVNLTKGTPAGDELASFARQKFLTAGGTSANWEKYLAAAPVPPRPEERQSVAITSQAVKQAAHPVVASNERKVSAATVRPQTKNPAAPVSGVQAENSKTTVKPEEPPHSSSQQISAKNSSARTSGNNEMAMATPPPPPPPSEPPYHVMPPHRPPALVKGAPISVGLLIQSSLAQKGTRQPIVYSLTDMVRRMRSYDEAFVMSFSKGLVFQEDLTSNDKALEDAMDEIAPQQGSAIYDAVTFAAGHLNRIARNPNRVLIVLASKVDPGEAVSPLELSSELNVSGVRIYCIGIDVFSQSDQARLRRLAAYTGGGAFFLNSASEVRSAIRTIAGDLGLSYPN